MDAPVVAAQPGVRPRVIAGAAMLGAVIATSLAMALALAAIARPASERRRGALVGLGLGGVVLFLVGVAAVVSLVTGTGVVGMWLAGYVGFAALCVLPIAGAAASADRRAAELTAASALAVSLAFMCAAPAISAQSMIP